MSITFITDNPKALLQAFDAHIEQKEPKGRINTWAKDSKQGGYTHQSDGWKEKALLKPTVTEPGKSPSGQTKPGKLTFNIFRFNDTSFDAVTFAYYHGHLIETFLAHFDDRFIEVDAKKTKPAAK